MAATQARIRYGTGKPGIKGMTDAIDAGEFPPIDTRTKKIVPLVFLASSLLMMIGLCAFAGIFSLAAVYLIPEPGFLDASQDMQWAKQVPWIPTHDYFLLGPEPGMAITKSGTGYTDVAIGTKGHGLPVINNTLAVVHFKLYTVDGPGQRPVFRFANSHGRLALTVVLGHYHFSAHSKVNQGLEDILLGMVEGGRRKGVVPPSAGYSLEGFKEERIPPNATLLYYVEMMHVGAYPGAWVDRSDGWYSNEQKYEHDNDL